MNNTSSALLERLGAAGASPLALLVKQAPLQRQLNTWDARSMRAGFSALTTGLLHWLTGPYVHSLEYTPATQRLRIRTLSVLCQAVHTDAHLQEVHPHAVVLGLASAQPASVRVCICVGCMAE